MIKDNQRQLNRLQVLLDILMIVAAYALAWYVLIGPKSWGALPPRIYFSVLIIIVPVLLFLNAVFRLYMPKRTIGRRTEFAGIVKANTVGLLLFSMVLYLGAKNPYIYHFSRSLVLLFYILATLFEAFERFAVRYTLRRIRRAGFNQKHVLMVGASDAAERYISLVRFNPQWGYHFNGILDDSAAAGTEVEGVRVIGRVNDLDRILEENSLDEIAITLPLKEYDKLGFIVHTCEKSGVHTKFIPDYFNVIPTRPYMEDLDGLPVINIRHVPLTELHNAVLKRALDILGGLVGLILFSPVMLVTALLIKLTSPGPVFFAQDRIGLHQKPFRMYKFRSMTVQTEEEERKEWTTRHDPRVTAVGRFIRRTSIDEMPQFWNILKGDMSLVGPRPERPFFVEKFREEIPHYMIKHQVRPGLTGWAQINGLRGDTSIEKRIEYDLFYIENWTFWFDVRILFLTFFKGFINKNAY